MDPPPPPPTPTDMLFILSRGNKTLTKKEKKTMAEYSDYIQEIVKTKKVRIFTSVCLTR